MILYRLLTPLAMLAGLFADHILGAPDCQCRTHQEMPR